jgi:hypothetical protein
MVCFNHVMDGIVCTLKKGKSQLTLPSLLPPLQPRFSDGRLFLRRASNHSTAASLVVFSVPSALPTAAAAALDTVKRRHADVAGVEAPAPS